MAQNRRKLYYDLTITTATGTSKQVTVAVTKEAASTVSAERYGGFLSALPALTGSTPPEEKRKQAVSAWFAFVRGSIAGAVLRSSAWSCAIDFVNSGGTTPVAYLTVGGSVASKIGQDAVYSRNFRVRLTSDVSGIGISNPTTVHGTLIVQRQHSIEV